MTRLGWSGVGALRADRRTALLASFVVLAVLVLVGCVRATADSADAVGPSVTPTTQGRPVTIAFAGNDR